MRRAAEGFDGFEPAGGGARRQIAFGNAQETRLGFVLAGETDFVKCQRLNERIERIESAEHDAAAFRCAAGGELANHAIVSRALPFLHAARQHDARGEIEARERGDGVHGLRGGSVVQRLAKIYTSEAVNRGKHWHERFENNGNWDDGTRP